MSSNYNTDKHDKCAHQMNVVAIAIKNSSEKKKNTCSKQRWSSSRLRRHWWLQPASSRNMVEGLAGKWRRTSGESSSSAGSSHPSGNTPPAVANIFKETNKMSAHNNRTRKVTLNIPRVIETDGSYFLCRPTIYVGFNEEYDFIIQSRKDVVQSKYTGGCVLLSINMINESINGEA